MTSGGFAIVAEPRRRPARLRRDHPELTREFAAVVEQLVQLVKANEA